jgi:cell division septum initiation protein DivIVA
MPPESSPTPNLDVAGIATRQFATVRKGYDTGEVRTYLRELSDAVVALQRAEADLRAKLGDAEARAVDAGKLDEHKLVAQLGEETARVLDAARAAASDIRQKAQEAAGRLISEANDQAHKIKDDVETEIANKRAEMLAEVDGLRREAGGELDRRRAEGNQLVTEMRREAQLECDSLKRSGEQARQDGLADADRTRASAREESKRLVDEALLVREHILQDLARRRQGSREQLERLNAARERLLDAYDVVKRTVEEATSELRVAPSEAKIAGDMAMRRVQAEPEPSIDDMEAEVATARIAGLLEPLPASAVVANAAAAVEEIEEPETDEDPADQFEDELTELEREIEVEVDEVEEAPETVEVEIEVAAEAIVEVEIAAEAPDEADDDEDEDEDDDAGTDDQAGADDHADMFARVGPPFDWRVEVEAANELMARGPLPGSSDIDELFARLRGQNDGPEVETEVPVGAVAVMADDDVQTVEGDDVEVVEDEDTAVEPDDEDAAAEQEQVEEQEDEQEEEQEEEVLDGRELVDALMHQRDEAIDDVERSLSRLLKRALADEQNEVLDLLRRNKPVTAEELLPTVAIHVARYADAARDDLDLAALYGAESVGGQPDGTAEALAAELGQTVVDPLRERITRSFAETGGDLGEITDRLRALYREWKGQRIGEAARHYVVAAYALGAYGAVPNGTPLTWLVDRNSDACPDADDNALAGRVCKGEAFPTGDHCPPAHLGCRCLVVPAAE